MCISVCRWYIYIYYINPWNRLRLFLCQNIMSSTSELSHDRQILSSLLWCCSTHFIICIKIQNKIHCHDITEILLKVALNTMNKPKQNNHVFYVHLDKISAISNMRVKDCPFLFQWMNPRTLVTMDTKEKMHVIDVRSEEELEVWK